jgi:hypothetical protein
MNWFWKETQKYFFIHFDEVDRLIDYLLPVSDGLDLVTAGKFYAFWKMLREVMLTPTFIYCSGRTSFLYALGKGFYRDVGLHSGNGITKCLLLDTLKANHIESILRKSSVQCAADAQTQLALEIYDQTGGVG